MGTKRNTKKTMTDRASVEEVYAILSTCEVALQRGAATSSGSADGAEGTAAGAMTASSWGSFVEGIQAATGSTGKRLEQEAFLAAAVLATAFGKPEAAAHFTARLGSLDGAPPAFCPRPAAANSPAPGWNFGGGTSGVIE